MTEDHPAPEQPLEVSRAASRRAAWIAAAVVLGLLGAFATAVWVLGSHGGTPPASGRTSGPLASTPTASGPDRTAHHRHRHLRDPLQPVRIHRDPGCPIRPPQIVQVMQFNIHAGISRFGGLGLARIAAEIRAAHPDIVSLNEVDSDTTRSDRIDESSYLAAATGMHPVYGPNLFGYDGGRFGNAILTTFPVESTRNIRLPHRRHTEPRGLLEADLRIGRQTVAFFSVHLSQGHVRGEDARVRQAEAMAGVVRGTRRPVIVSGDFNSRPTDLPVRIMRQYLLDAQEQGGTGSGLTVPEADPQNRIDYILYDNHFGIVPGSTQVLPSGSSDHRSVWTELVLRPRGQC
ncbi:MAG: endonuclease/exonuclease/phosphatase family protein [Nocardioides sp.]